MEKQGTQAWPVVDLKGAYKQKHDKLHPKMFEGQEFNSLMASVGKKRLWVTYKDGGHYFKVEWLPTGELIYEDLSLGAAIRIFNDTDENSRPFKKS